jgi:hypothetical protein
MKITRKQKDEIEFYKRHYNINPTDIDIEEFINHTVHGKKCKGLKELMYSNTKNLFNCKRWLDITVKAWTEDIKSGWTSSQWLLDDEEDPFIIGIIERVGRNTTVKAKFDNRLHIRRK